MAFGVCHDLLSRDLNPRFHLRVGLRDPGHECVRHGIESQDSARLIGHTAFGYTRISEDVQNVDVQQVCLQIAACVHLHVPIHWYPLKPL
jgi:hypothetical protein